MKDRLIQEKLHDLYREAEEITLHPADNVVILSDLHMGNGGSRDDFSRNSELLRYVLEHYYLHNRYKLVLNGDIEELQRFSYERIRETWKNLYALFSKFDARTALYKLYGNHDSLLHSFSQAIPKQVKPVLPALKINYQGRIFFIFHGHQASYYYERFNSFAGVILKYVARPLRIRNFSVAHNSLKKYRIEKRVYDYSNRQKIVSIIGHTHRPLFESLSKKDFLRFKIENLCREYPGAQSEEQVTIEHAIEQYKEELARVHRSKKDGELNSLYSSSLLVPSLFNSGCTIGKRGLTSIEIADSTIRLVHWFDEKKTKKQFSANGSRPEQLGNSPYCRLVLKRDDIRYIFSRIRLLT